MKKYFLLTLALIVSCAEQKVDNKLRVVVPIEPISMTPFDSNDIASYRARWQIFDRLVNMSNGVVTPMLATSWSNIDPTTIEISLRSNVVFHNGQPFTAEDAADSINRAVNAPTLSSVLGIIQGAEVVGDLKIQMKLRQAYADGLKLLAHAGVLVANKKAMESSNPEDQYIGTGPFKFVQWNRGQNVILSNNTEYWGEKSPVDAIEILVVPDASVRLISVETGDVDIAYDIDGSDREALLGNENVVYNEAPSPTVHYLGFNTSKAPYNNPKFRDAVAYTLDLNGIVNNVAFGAGEPANSLLQASIAGANTSLVPRVQDLEKAKELLKEVDLPENFVMPIYAIDGPRKKMAEIIQANLTEAGIPAEVRVLEWGTMLDYARKGNMDSFVLGWTTIPSIADIGLYSLVHSKNAGVNGNYTFYNNPRVDELLDKARVTFDVDAQNAIYAEIQEILYNDKPMIPLFHPYVNAAYRKNVSNFQLNQFSVHELNKVSKN